MAGLELEDVVPLHLAEISFPNTHPLSGQTGQVFGFAICHLQGVILFETGIGTGNDVIDTAYQVVRRPLEAELARREHRVDEVRAIVNSHLHFDHCGNNAMFPGVPIYVHTTERKAALQPGYTVPEWVSFPGAEYREITTETTIAEHVKVISTPGHTIGHQSVVVETNAGPVVLAGQAIYSKAEYDHIVTTSTVPPEDPAPDPERYLASAQRLIALRARRVYFSHDAQIWEQLPR
jgi:N-acyl homoserine lactone hydrolase